MATTKKVARTGSLKKKAVPKKSASSTRAKTPKEKSVTKKATAKTVTKKTAVKKKATSKKKVVKKLSVKKVVKQKDKKANEVSIKDETTRAESFQKKLDALSVKNSKKISKKTLAKKPSFLPAITKAPLGLAVLPKTRFPVSIDTFAVQSARFGGLLFVAFGAFFSLVYSQYIWNAPLIASDVSGVQMLGLPGTCDSASLSPTEFDSCLAGAETQLDEVVYEPPLTFSIGDSEVLSGIVPIYVHVADAERVKVLVFKESNTDPIYLGYATLVEQGTWLYQWDTTKVDDNSYKIAADVHSVYTIGSAYRGSDDKYVAVRNNVDEEASSIEVPETLEDLLLEDATPSADLRLKTSNPIVGIADFEVRVANANKVSLVARSVSSGLDTVLGEAVYESNGRWKYSWNTTSYTNGDYIVKTRVRNQYGTYTSGVVALTVKNAKQSLTDSTQIKTPLETKDAAVAPLDSTVSVPKATLQIANSGTLSGVVDVLVDIQQASFVEIWVIPEGSQTRKIIGLASLSQSGASKWRYTLNTSQIPNAKYEIFARVKNKFGLYESNFTKIDVYNKPITPVVTALKQQSTEKIDEALKVEQSILDQLTVAKSAPATTESESDIEQIAAVSEKKKDSVGELIKKFRTEIDAELQRLTVAYRSGDAEAIARAENRLTKLTQEILASELNSVGSDIPASELSERIAQVVAEHKVLSQRVEKIIIERVGDDVFNDSDSDGISDYDERTLYTTDPFSADTDGDGFTDGAEVAEGYDPLDSKREVTILYESPQDTGVIREDILKVESIEAVLPNEFSVDTDGVDAQAVISGRALPNSFATLYIFSTPIVVTVKTQEDGTWKYRFDKELEDGEHNVYVGLTDNAGRIVAKSEPFTFVKEAQAFSPVDASVAGSVITQQTDDSLLSTYMIYLILSISVVSIGLVLILLGLHLDTRQRRFKAVVNTEEES